MIKLEDNVNKIKNFINEKEKDNRIILICVDGPCASGKTTTINCLKNVTIIHADDHFDSKPINYDYLYKLLENIKNSNVIEEKCYDCHNDTFKILKKNVCKTIILEGVYTYNSPLRQLFDYFIYFDVDKTLQLERINERDNKEDYINKWMIKEKEYFDSFNFKEFADLIIE